MVSKPPYGQGHGQKGNGPRACHRGEALPVRRRRAPRRADRDESLPQGLIAGRASTLTRMSAASEGSNPFADTEDQAALRQLARDVAERELAPMARHGDETEEFPQWAWDGMSKAELFGIQIGERW